MNKSSYYKKLFLIAGLWDLAAAIPAWLGMILMPDFTSSFFGMAPPAILYPYHAFFSSTIAIGIGYIIVSRDITKNHGIVVLGIISKIFYFIDCVITFALKEANIQVVLTGIVDIIFACLFIEFLLSVKKGAMKT
jgi:hypothetical protein